MARSTAVSGLTTSTSPLRRHMLVASPGRSPNPALPAKSRPPRRWFLFRCGSRRPRTPWRVLLEHFSPKQTTFAPFARFRADSTWQAANHCRLVPDREGAGRGVTPNAAAMDSVKTNRAGGPLGHDAAKRSQATSSTSWPIPLTERYCKSAPPMTTVGPVWCRCCKHPAARSPSSSDCLLTPWMPKSRSPTPHRYRRDCASSAASGGLRCAAASLGARAVVRLTQPQSPVGEGIRWYHGIGCRPPLRRGSYAPIPRVASSGFNSNRTFKRPDQQDPPILSSNVVGVELVPARTTILHVPGFVPASAVSFTEPAPGAVPGSVILDTMISPAPVNIV
jgi:hypothetical protein